MKFRTTVELDVEVECELSDELCCEWIGVRFPRGGKPDLTEAQLDALKDEAVAEERMRRCIAEESDADWRAECRTHGP